MKQIARLVLNVDFRVVEKKSHRSGYEQPFYWLAFEQLQAGRALGTALRVRVSEDEFNSVELGDFFELLRKP